MCGGREFWQGSRAMLSLASLPDHVFPRQIYSPLLSFPLPLIPQIPPSYSFSSPYNLPFLSYSHSINLISLFIYLSCLPFLLFSLRYLPSSSPSFPNQFSISDLLLSSSNTHTSLSHLLPLLGITNYHYNICLILSRIFLCYPFEIPGSLNIPD